MIQSMKRERGAPGFMSAQELKALACACPSLAELNIHDAMQQTDEGVTPLLHLSTSVTSLSVGGAAFDNEAAAIVGQLTQLRELQWRVSPDLTDSGLQHLTALQQLDDLCIHATGLSDEVLNGLDWEVSALYLRAAPEVSLSGCWLGRVFIPHRHCALCALAPA
jgi:hypothetical protein